MKPESLTLVRWGKTNVIYIASYREHTSKALRYGTHSQGISQFYLHTPRSSANGMNHTCLCLPSRRWYSFTDPGGMEGWVGVMCIYDNTNDNGNYDKLSWQFMKMIMTMMMFYLCTAGVYPLAFMMSVEVWSAEDFALVSVEGTSSGVSSQM